MTPRIKSTRPAIYMAGPWFTAGEPERLAKIEQLMNELGLTYYSPRV